jgi:hypothetical protein
MDAQASTRVVRHPAALSRQTLSGTIVLPPDRDEFKLLEPPGDEIWAAIAEPVAVEDLVVRLASVFEAPTDEVRTDVSRFLDDLVGAGLAVEVRAQGPESRDVGP